MSQYLCRMHLWSHWSRHYTRNITVQGKATAAYSVIENQFSRNVAYSPREIDETCQPRQDKLTKRVDYLPPNNFANKHINSDLLNAPLLHSSDSQCVNVCTSNYLQVLNASREHGNRTKSVLKNENEHLNHSSVLEMDYEISGNHAYFELYLSQCGSKTESKHTEKRLYLARSRLPNNRRLNSKRRIHGQLSEDQLGNMATSVTRIYEMENDNIDKHNIQSIHSMRICSVGDTAYIALIENLSPRGKMLKFIRVAGNKYRRGRTNTSLSTIKTFSSTIYPIDNMHFLLHGTSKDMKFCRFFYTLLDPMERAWQVRMAYICGTTGNITNDRPIYTEKKNDRFVSINASKDGRILFIASGSHHGTHDVYCIKQEKTTRLYRLHQPLTERLFLEHRRGCIYCIYEDRQHHVEINRYMLDQHDLDYSIDFSGVPKTIINIPRKNGVRYSISTLPSKTLKHVCRRWKKSGLGIAQSDSGSTHRRYVWFKLNQINEAIVTDIDMTCNALVLYLSIPPSKPMVATLRFARKGRRREYRTAESAMYNLNIPVGVGVIEPRGNTNFYGTYVRFIIRTPGSGDIHCYVDLANDHNIGTEKNNSGMNEHLDGSNNICSKVKLHKPIPPQVFCSALNRHLPLHSTHYIDSRDGSCKIPITLVRFGSDTTNDVNAAFRNPRNKCVVYFYGAYGHNLAVDNDLEHNILLQMGYTLCFAHVRGGGELGHIWHSGAVKSFKYKGVYDLIDVIEFLIANNMAQRSSIALSSTSAGAILAACVYNMRPDLCNCISLKLPFLDVFGSIHDTNEPLSSLEKEEFGNESNVECVYSYSPCDNTGEPGHLKPSLIIQCNSDDTRAPLRHTVSYIRQHRTNWDRTFLRISSGGHTDGNTAEEHEQWITERISIMENLLEGYVA